MKTINSSPWVSQFDGLMERRTFKSRAEYIPKTPQGLLTSPTYLAESSLSNALKEVIFLSVADLDILQRLLERSHAYAIGAYSSAQQYMANMMSKELKIPSPAPICFTGLAGVGKSTLFTAFENILPAAKEIDVQSAMLDRKLRFISHVRINVRTSRNFKEFLAPLLYFNTKHDDKDVAVQMSPGAAAKTAVRNSYRFGSYATLLDEIQFQTVDSNASANQTKILLMMSYINAPLIYAANYSLCNKLFKRNQEDRDRLLGDVIVIRPLELNDQGLGSFLKVYDRILGDCVDGSLCSFLPEYAAMTLGIRRKICELTVATFNEMRACKDTKIKKSHLKTAFEKRLTESFRKDIRDLHQINGLMSPKGVDANLWCPFGIEYNRFNFPPEFRDNTAERTFTNDVLLSQLTGVEKRYVKAFEKSENSTQASQEHQNKSSRAPSLPKRKSVRSAADLIRNTIAHKVS